MMPWLNRCACSNPAIDAVLDEAPAQLDLDARKALLIEATDIAFRD
jgi:ABC-type transport system substrate-binding protein